MPLHSALYTTRQGAGAIVHLHSTHSVAVSMLPDIDPANVLPPMTAYYVMRVGRTALVPYYRPGDPAVADAIRGLAGRYSAVLLANHGPVVAGKDLEAAVYATEELEETAKLRLLLHGLNPRLLKPSAGPRSRHTLQAGQGDCRGHARGRQRNCCSHDHHPSHNADESMPRFSANLGFLFTEHSEIERIAAAAASGFKAVEMHWPYQVPAAEMRSALARSEVTMLGLNTPVGNACRGRFRAGCLAGT